MNQTSLSLSRKKVFRGTFLLIAQPLLLNAISVPVTAYIIRTLGAEGYGQWNLALSLISMVAFFGNLGLRMLLVRSLVTCPERASILAAQHLSLRFVLSIFAGGLALIICCCLRYPLVVFACTAIASAGLVLTSVSSALLDVFSAMQRLTVLAVINLVAGIVLTVASVLVMWRHSGPVGLSIAYLSGPAIAFALAWGFTQRYLFKLKVQWNSCGFSDLLQQARGLSFQLAIGVVAAQLEALLIPKLVGIGSFGFFSAGFLIASRLSIIPEAINTACYPLLANAYTQGKRPLILAFARYFIMSSLLCVPTAVIIALLAHPIANLLFPTRALACQSVIQITIWMLPLFAWGGVLSYTLNATKHEIAETRVVGRSTLCGLVISAILILQFGLVGACWALLVRHAISLLLRIPHVITILKQSDPEQGAPYMATNVHIENDSVTRASI